STSAQPLPPPATPSPPSSTPGPAIEQLAGELVATAACLVARGLSELRERGQIRMSADTRLWGGELMAALITLREASAFAFAEAGLDFERVGKEHGARALRERCGRTVRQRTTDELGEAVPGVPA